MRKLIFGFLIFALSLPFTSLAQQTIPSSSRSQKAISRVRPRLAQEFSNSKLLVGSPIFVRIFKEEEKLEIWVKNKDKFQLFREYQICTYGSESLGPKIKQGDGKAPEGFYFVTPNRLNPVSQFHLSFNLGYPNRYDRVHRRTGGALMVHGSCVSIGCYAMTDEKIEEIYAIADAALRNGQEFFRVHIFPFRMTTENMKKHDKSKWYSFWENLKEGHDFFEQNNHIPPNVEVVNKRYVFEQSL